MTKEQQTRVWELRKSKPDNNKRNASSVVSEEAPEAVISDNEERERP